MVEIVYQVFDRNDRVHTKRKSFKTPEALHKFMDKIVEKDDFYRILATSNDEETLIQL